MDKSFLNPSFTELGVATFQLTHIYPTPGATYLSELQFINSNTTVRSHTILRNVDYLDRISTHQYTIQFIRLVEAFDPPQTHYGVCREA